MTPRAVRKVRVALISTTATLVAVLLLAEIAFRVVLPTPTPDELGRRSIPYERSLFSRTTFVRQDREARGPGGEVFHLNRLGYRGPMFSVKKPEGTTRIMIYGGSSVFDYRLTEGRDWPRRLETKLRGRGLSAVEVINAGVPGSAAFDCLGRFFAEGHMFSPDYVLLYTAWNDTKLFRHDAPLLRVVEPFQGNPFLEYQGPIDRVLCELSRFYVRLRTRYYVIRKRYGPEGLIPEGVYVSRLSKHALEQYKLTNAMFVEMARAVGAIPVLVTEGRLVTASNTPEQRKLIDYEMPLLTHEALAEAFAQSDRIVTEVAREKGVSLIDVSGVVTGRNEYFHDHVHLTDAGSEKVSQLIADALAPMLAGAARH